MTARDLNALRPGDLVALYCDRLGWNVIPAKGKAPVGAWKQSQTTRPTAAQRDKLTRHVERGEPAFLVCGEISAGVIVLDLDSQAAVERWRSRLNGGWDDIPRARTPRGGCHLFFTSREPVKSSSGADWDLRANGTGVVVPSGNGRRSWEVPPGDALPDFALIEKLIRQDARDARRAERAAADADGAISAGERETTLVRSAGAMQRVGMSKAAILSALLTENEERCEPPLAQADIERIAGSVARYATGFEAEVKREVDRLRVRDAARHLLLAERAITGSRSLLSLEDAKRAVEEPIDWVIPQLLAAGDKAVIAGPPKSLKTWLALNLINAVVTAGRPCEQAMWAVQDPQSVLFIQEEGTHQRWAHRLMALAEDHPPDAQAPIHYAHRTGMSLLNEASVAWLIEQAHSVAARMIVLDPLQRIMPGVNENDASEVGPAWDAIHKIASDTEAAVIVIHHARKGDGAASMDAIRGSSRIAGEVDLMLVLRRVERGTLELYLEGRDLPPRANGEDGNLEIRYEPEEPHKMKVAGPSISIKGPTNRTQPAVERVLREAKEQARGPLSTTEIAERVGRDRSNVSRALKELHADNRITKIAGKGKALTWEWIA